MKNIKEIVNKALSDYPLNTFSGEAMIELETMLCSSLTSLLEGLKEEAPKERSLFSEDGCRGAENRRYNKGWNKYRQEVIKLIDSLK